MPQTAIYNHAKNLELLKFNFRENLAINHTISSIILKWYPYPALYHRAKIQEQPITDFRENEKMISTLDSLSYLDWIKIFPGYKVIVRWYILLPSTILQE